MTANSGADEVQTSFGGYGSARLVLNYQQLMEAYAAAEHTTAPGLMVPASDYEAYVNLFEAYAASRAITEYDHVHYERYKVTSGMFTRYLDDGGRVLELGTSSLFGSFLRDVHNLEVGTYNADLSEAFDVPDSSLDHVLCLEVLGHIKDVNALETSEELYRSFNYSGIMNVLLESFRVLRPGGTLLVSTPNATSVDCIARILEKNHPHIFDPHVRELAPKQVKAFAERAGFFVEAFGTFFAWQTTETGLRNRLLDALMSLGFDASDRGDEACFVLRKPIKNSDVPVASYVPGLDDFQAMAGRGARETAAFWRDRHQAGVVPEYEDVLADVFARFLREGDVVVDVGVNIGRHFTRFHELVGAAGRVIGFEPVPDFASHSRALVGPHAEIRQKALSNAPGVGEFLFMTKAVGESGFKERTSDGDRGATPIQVEISTLDIELADINALRYIKIDTEGHEISVLSGASDIIRKYRPFISVEWGQPTYSLYGHSTSSLYELCEGLGYVISDLFGNVVQDHDEWLSVSDQSFWDFFLIPQEKEGEWASYFVTPTPE